MSACRVEGSTSIQCFSHANGIEPSRNNIKKENNLVTKKMRAKCPHLRNDDRLCHSPHIDCIDI